MRLVFCNIPLQQNFSAMNYKATGNSRIIYDKPVLFPINKVLATTLKKNDDVKVVLLKKLDSNIIDNKNENYFINELNDINKQIGANIKYTVINSDYEEDKNNVHEKVMKDMIGELNHNCKIYSDITYGPKSLPIILLSVLNFAEKYFNCEIEDIVYGQVSFCKDEDGRSYATAPVLCNMKSLYYIGRINDLINCSNTNDALKALNILLDL